MSNNVLYKFSDLSKEVQNTVRKNVGQNSECVMEHMENLTECGTIIGLNKVEFNELDMFGELGKYISSIDGKHYLSLDKFLSLKVIKSFVLGGYGEGIDYIDEIDSEKLQVVTNFIVNYYRDSQMGIIDEGALDFYVERQSSGPWLC